MQRQSSFTRRIIINKNISSVFNSWTQQGAMEKWFLKTATFFRKDVAIAKGNSIKAGDTYKWVWHTWPDNIQEGVVTRCETNKTFEFTFDPGGNVEITFDETGPEKTEIVLRQFDIITDGESWYHYFYGCSLGWSFWMVNLKAFLEHGVVLDQREILYSDEKHVQFVNQ